VPAIGNVTKRKWQRVDRIHNTPLQTVRKLFAVKVDRTSILPAACLHPHVAVIIFPVAPIMVAIPAFQSPGKNAVSII